MVGGYGVGRRNVLDAPGEEKCLKCAMSLGWALYRYVPTRCRRRSIAELESSGDRFLDGDQRLTEAQLGRDISLGNYYADQRS